ncbi:hypothetical protein [Paraburkholderia sp. HD33-4]|uniref:hypothetical protein n=1 Tax=Paraburkholderia sp. HD33-4 TaxID=2883242 RepID=UPI001F377172|nr:hypothetical protein [Paraburkholderia sp. HD33-4]
MSDKPSLQILCSYAYLQTKPPMLQHLWRFDREYPGKLDLLVDSGAFTAWNKGFELTLGGYCKFLTTLPVKPWRYIALDVIENPERTRENLKRMRDAGFDPIPVFTPGESFDHIEELYDGTDLIACGGVAGKYSSYGQSYLGRVMRQVGARKIHLLGVTHTDIIKRFRPYSSDSSSWEVARRFGRVNFYAGYGRMNIMDREDFLKAPSDAIFAQAGRAGLDLSGLTREKCWRGRKSLTSQLTAASWVSMQRDTRKNIGTQIFLAAVDPHAVNLLIEAWKAVP